MKVEIYGYDSLSVDSYVYDDISEVDDQTFAFTQNSDFISSLNGDLSQFGNFNYKLSEKLSLAKVDSFYKSSNHKLYPKSTDAVVTKTRLEKMDSGEQTNWDEELKLDLDENSQYMLDESKLFYRRRKIQENSHIVEESDINMRPSRFKTSDAINSKEYNSNYSESRRIKICCKKVIIEFPK